MVDTNQPMVLVVDDIAGMRLILREMLQDLGFERIEEAVDGEDAFKKVLAEKPLIIFSDYMMPKVDGLDFLVRVRKTPALATVPFVLISAVADKDIVSHAFSLGLTKYFTKPVSFPEIQEYVAEFRASLTG